MGIGGHFNDMKVEVGRSLEGVALKSESVVGAPKLPNVY
jgi:hypothetical protein